MLIEIGFIDNTNDNNIFDTRRNAIIKALAKAILSQLGITYIEPVVSTPQAPQTQTNGQTFYRVMVGSYSVKENADSQLQRLKAAGFDATIIVFNK